MLAGSSLMQYAKAVKPTREPNTVRYARPIQASRPATAKAERSSPNPAEIANSASAPAIISTAAAVNRGSRFGTDCA